MKNDFEDLMKEKVTVKQWKSICSKLEEGNNFELHIQQVYVNELENGQM